MKYFHFVFFILGILNSVDASSASNSLVATEIRYTSHEASEVYLVWGVNGWNTQHKNPLPAGTYIKDGLLYTPMKFQDERFSLHLKVKPGTTIDYVFWITKGLRNRNTDVWDNNSAAKKKDYHTLALKNEVVLVESNLPARPKEVLSLLDFAWPILISLSVCFLAFLLIRRYRFRHISLCPRADRIVFAGGGILLLALFLIRSSVTMMSWDLYVHPFGFIPRILWSGFYDFLYVAFLMIAFYFILRLFWRFPRMRSVIAYSFVAIGFFSLIAGILNIRTVEMLGKPFNYRWLYYSDFLSSSESQSALLSNLSYSYVMNMLAICVAAALAGTLLANILEILLRRCIISRLLLAGVACIPVGYAAFAHREVHMYKWNYDKLANPIVAFVESLPVLTQSSKLFTMDVPDSLKTFGNKPGYNFAYHYPEARNKIRNVILFVLESTPAEYVQPYDRQYKVTPELDKHLVNSIVFDNMYAHAPATNKSMVCLLGSVYPWLSFASITQEHPDIQIPTLSSELKQYGYRTAFFNSADNSFQGSGDFLVHRKFDIVSDCKSVVCDSLFHPTDEAGNPLDGIDDECTEREMVSWLKDDKVNPFFAVMWTYQTHYPYYVLTPEKKHNTSDPVFNRYLNAVQHSDEVLGKLLDELKRNGLSESTLVVVIGDHGEAFGRHDQTTHASKIYEENVHVPCVFINPMFKGERISEVGGLVDIAPTIMSMLDLPQAELWQGTDILTPVKNKRVYFFAPWSDYYFGYREGNRKYIFNATKNITEIYDLSTDPYETNNLAPQLAGEVEHSHHCLAAWAQYNNRFIGNLIAP